MKLVFVTKSMSLPGGGGAERVLVELTAALARRGHVLTVITFDQAASEDFYALHPDVVRVRLGVGAVTERSLLSEVLQRSRNLRRCVIGVRPDVAVGFMLSSYVPLGLSLIGTRIPVVASEHIDYSHWQQRRGQFAAIRFTKLLYAAMTIPSEAVRRGYPREIAKKMIAIPNPVKADVASKAAQRPSSRKILLSVGRLAKQKDHRTLVNAFAIVADGFPEWDLRIVGEGELRGPLAKQISALGLETRIALPGATSAIEREYSDADVYVHPARHESFGLTTAEALAHGIPAIGFADCPGTNELIHNRLNGLLVEGHHRTEALAGALETIMGSDQLRCELGRRGPSSVSQFQIAGIADRWEALFNKVSRRFGRVPKHD